MTRHLLRALLLLSALAHLPYLCSAENPSSVSKAGYVRSSGNPRVLVFVHGLFSGPEAWRCDPSHDWPEMIAEDKSPAFSNTDIYVAQYRTPKHGGHMTVSDLITELAVTLQSDGVFSRHREVIFVAHSLGGIMTEELLLTYRDKAWIDKVSAIFLYATPLEGSKVADIAKMFRHDPLLPQLSTGDNNLLLAEMDERWLHKGISIKRYCAYETLNEHGFKVVSRTSATRGCDDATAIDTDHNHIVKPCSTADLSYVYLQSQLAQMIVSDLGRDFGQTLKIEASSSYDQKEGFQEQFLVRNEGRLPALALHYGCAVKSVQLREGKDPLFDLKLDKPHTVVYFMVPVMNSLPKLEVGDQTTIDCDYTMRPGPNMTKAEIEIVAAYRTNESRSELISSQRFSGRRDVLGQFQWTAGSAIPSLLENVSGNAMSQVVFIMPFGGTNRDKAPAPTPEALWDLTKAWIPVFKRRGNIIGASTMLDGKYD